LDFRKMWGCKRKLWRCWKKRP